MHSVFGLLEDDGVISLENLVGALKPRSAGKQCMKMAFGVRAIIFVKRPWKSFLRCSASCFWPMDAQTSE